MFVTFQGSGLTVSSCMYRLPLLPVQYYTSVPNRQWRHFTADASATAPASYSVALMIVKKGGNENNMVITLHCCLIVHPGVSRALDIGRCTRAGMKDAQASRFTA